MKETDQLKTLTESLGQLEEAPATKFNVIVVERDDSASSFKKVISGTNVKDVLFKLLSWFTGDSDEAREMMDDGNIVKAKGMYIFESNEHTYIIMKK